MDTLSLSTVPTTFYSFPLLPKELRLDIWRLSLPAPRIIKISYRKHKTDIIWHFFRNSRFLNTNLTLVNSEANAVFNKAYMSVKSFDGTVRETKLIRIKIDYQRDTLYISANAHASLCDYYKRWLSPDVISVDVNGANDEHLRDALWLGRARNVAVDWRIMRNRNVTRDEQYASPQEHTRASQVLLHVLKMFPKARPVVLVVHERGPSSETYELAQWADPILTEDWQGSYVQKRIMEWLPAKLAELKPETDIVGVPDFAYKCLVIRGAP